MLRETIYSLFDVEDEVKYVQQYEEEEDPISNEDGEVPETSGMCGKPTQRHIQKRILQRRDHDFFLSLRHTQGIPSMLVDMETYFALTCVGLAENLLHHILLPAKLMILGRRRCTTRELMAMGIMFCCLIVYWVCNSSTTQLYSYLYHAVRRTSFIKLVIIFSMLDVLDKALSSFSQDTLEIFYAVVEDKVIEWNGKRKQKARQAKKNKDEKDPNTGSTKMGSKKEGRPSTSSRSKASLSSDTATHCTRSRRIGESRQLSIANVTTPGSPRNEMSGANTLAEGPAETLDTASGAPSPSRLPRRREESPFRVVDDPPVFSHTLLLGTGLAALLSVALHSLSLLLMAVSLNVAINSDANSFLALLVSNNFNELKSNIFKKYSAESFHALCVVDAIERLQYVFLFIVLIMQYMTEHVNPMVIVYALVILTTEVFIDFSKLLFCCKFNAIPLAVFRSYAQLSLLDIASEKVLWQLPEAVAVRVVKPVDPIPLAAPPPHIGQLNPSYAKLLFPSFGFAPKNVRRAGFDVLAYASLLLWSMFHAGAQLFFAAPSVLFLCAVALVLAKLLMSSFITGLSARFVFRSLLEPRPESMAAPTAPVAGRPPPTSGTGSSSLLQEGTPSGGQNASPGSAKQEGAPSTSSGASSPVKPPVNPFSLSSPSPERPLESKEIEEKPGKSTSSSDVILQLTPLLCALLKVDRFDLQAGKKK